MPLPPSLLAHARRLGAALLLAAVCGVAHAGTTSLGGRFDTDDQLFEWRFVLDAAQPVAVRSFGFAGGTQVDGQTVVAGGFAPVLALFDDAGLLLQLHPGSTGGCAAAAIDAATGFGWDPCFTAQLTAGSYTLVLSQDGNLPPGPMLADGYSRAGEADYTGWLALGRSARFVLADGSLRDGHWALDISAAAIDEPPTFALFSAALLTAGALHRLRRGRHGKRFFRDRSNTR